MPYVKPEVREVLDHPRNPKTPNEPGELNYKITKLCDQYLGRFGNLHKIGYADINEVIGVLECAKLELWRRIAVPYETEKMKTNGDVYSPENLTNITWKLGDSKTKETYQHWFFWDRREVTKDRRQVIDMKAKDARQSKLSLSDPRCLRNHNINGRRIGDTTDWRTLPMIKKIVENRVNVMDRRVKYDAVAAAKRQEWIKEAVGDNHPSGKRSFQGQHNFGRRKNDLMPLTY